MSYWDNFEEVSPSDYWGQFEETEAQTPSLSPGQTSDLHKGLDKVLGGLTKVDQGGSFGLGKKVGGLANAVGSAPVDWVASLMGKENVPSFADRYNEVVNSAVESGERFEKEHPIASFGLELASGIANPVNLKGMDMVNKIGKFRYRLPALAGLGAVTGVADTAGRYNSVDKMSKELENSMLTGAALNVSLPLAGGTSNLLGKGVRKFLGFTTGAGNAIDVAYDAGKRGSKVFLENMRGEAPVGQVVDDVKEALTGLKIAKNDEYLKGLKKAGEDVKHIDISPIRNDFEIIKKSQNYKGFNKADKATQRATKEIENILSNFEQTPAAHDVIGLDALKQSIQDISYPFEQRAANALVGRMANNVKNSIEKQSPKYAEVMKDYALASDSIDEISKNLLGSGKKVNTATALGKLQRAFRDEYGRSLINKLGSEKIIDEVAGQTLNTWLPRGLIGSLGGLGTISTALSSPVTLLSMPLYSPKAMGRAAYLAGKASPLMSRYGGKINPATFGFSLKE